MTQRYIDLAFDDTSPRSFGGFDNENEATVIRLKVLDPDAKYYIEIEQACGKHDKYCSDVLPVDDGYAVFEVPRDFTHETLYVQGVMKVDGMCRKTARVRVGFSHSINALDELPESQPSWADSVDERIDGLEMGMKDAVTYTPQTLTEEQKSQARTNIGAFPAAVVPYFYKTGFVGVQYDARNAPAFSIIQEAGEDWKNEGHPPYTTIKEIEFPCIKTDSYMSSPGVGEFHLLDAAGVLWHCGIYVGGTSLPIFYLTKVNASIVIHGTIDADDDTIIKLNEQESQYILTQHRQVEIEVLVGQSKQRLVHFGFSNDSMLFFSCGPGVFIWGIWNSNERDVIRIFQYSLNQVPLQPILRTWTDEQESI